MNNHILPEFLYKIKPFTYIGLGVYVWINLSTVYAVISGTLLVGAGILVLLLRQSASYQKSRQRVRLRDTKGYGLDEGYKDSLHVTIQ